MTRPASQNTQRMRDQLFFEGEEAARRYSRFWMLLVLAAIIASAGVVNDSTATVIGAMIVAPLMTPILGTSLAVALGDRTNLLRCLGLVVLGALVVIAIGWLMGVFVVTPVVAATNSQVAGRIHPDLVDLVAALATGAVGAIALNRDDISDTLPGVAIAISLVPPLAVCGLTLQSGAPAQAVGALFLFLVNVAAILATSLVVFGVYGVYAAGTQAQSLAMVGVNRRRATVIIAAFALIIVVPLAIGAKVVDVDARHESKVQGLAQTWVKPAGWRVVSVTTDNHGTVVKAAGPDPAPAPAALRAAMNQAGLSGVDLRVELVPETEVNLPGH